MYWRSLLAAGAGLGLVNAIMLRFSCSQLVVDRLDPLVNPGMLPSPHLHQVVGGNTFNASMGADLASTATCTTCTAAEDFSNYWTAVLFFRARNGSFHRVSTFGNGLGFSSANGGQTVYYLSNGKATSFKPGFRMTVGNPTFRTQQQLQSHYKMMTYTCLASPMTRNAGTLGFPKTPCKGGIMVSIRFPTCWDGKTLDPPDHQSHTIYPTGSRCPSTHPVSIPQVFYETYWNTAPFNDKSLWPADGSQPFLWSMGDPTGYGTHGDYIFGWKGNALQKALDSSNCNSDLLGNSLNCPAVKGQTIAQGNKCTVKRTVREDLDSWTSTLPGGMGVVM